MSKLKNRLHDWLEEIGYGLGYDWNELPEINDLEIVQQNNIHVWEYKGQTKKEYYNEF